MFVKVSEGQTEFAVNMAQVKFLTPTGGKELINLSRKGCDQPGCVLTFLDGSTRTIDQSVDEIMGKANGRA